MTNFSDYIKNKSFENLETEDKKSSNEHLEQLIDKYSKFSDNDLMNEFLKLTIERKRQGKLSEGELDILKSTIMPYLDDNQKNSLENLLEMIKNV